LELGCTAKRRPQEGNIAKSELRKNQTTAIEHTVIIDELEIERQSI